MKATTVSFVVGIAGIRLHMSGGDTNESGLFPVPSRPGEPVHIVCPWLSEDGLYQ